MEFGIVTPIDPEGLLVWYGSLSLESAKEIRAELIQSVRAEKTERENLLLRRIDDFYLVRSWCSYPIEQSEGYKWPVQRDQYQLRLRQFLSYHTDMGQSIYAAEWHEGAYAYICYGNPDMGVIIPHPERFFAYTPPIEYAGMTPAEVRRHLNAPDSGHIHALIPSDAEQSMSSASVQAKKSKAQGELSALAQTMEDVKHARTDELSKLKKEIEEKQAELQRQIDAKMAELTETKKALEAQVEQMENQIWLLDSQIYSIRCYAGETVQFARIRAGKQAPDTEPIVIHQKLRYLDEDLARITSLYQIEWGDIPMFETFLQHHPLALDTFAPNERCISLVRLSRTGTQLADDAERPFQNMLAEYDYYHGKTVGIIIRNGENLYLGWTDESRIHITDDLIISQIITETLPYEEKAFASESDRERWEKEQKAQRRQILDGMVSRQFVYSILQGVVDHSDILPLPKGVTLGKQSEFVQYAVADLWLADNRYGSFTDIIERCNQTIKRGDPVLITQKLVPERRQTYSGYVSQAWNNVRGRGNANRTHDCRADDCTIYPVNLVEYDEPVQMVRYRYLVSPSSIDEERNPSARPHWHTAEIEKRRYDNISLSQKELLEEYEYRKRHVFISVKKRDPINWQGYQGADPRSNFELYYGEYIALTYLNSIWLEYVITTKSLGGWTIAGKTVPYAHGIRYLNTALQFVREREAEEKQYLDAADPSITQDSDWPLRLSEWKLAFGVRELNAYQAKRFARFQARAGQGRGEG